MQKNPYGVLGLHPHAPRELVEEAYWLQIDEVQRGPRDPESRQRMTALNQAHEQIAAAVAEHPGHAEQAPALAEPGSFDDYYALLCLDSAATNSVVKLAFGVMRRRIDAAAGEYRFRQLTQARDVLLDPVQRKHYDEWLHEHADVPFPSQLENRAPEVVEAPASPPAPPRKRPRAASTTRKSTAIGKAAQATADAERLAKIERNKQELMDRADQLLRVFEARTPAPANGLSGSPVTPEPNSTGDADAPALAHGSEESSNDRLVRVEAEAAELLRRIDDLLRTMDAPAAPAEAAPVLNADGNGAAPVTRKPKSPAKGAGKTRAPKSDRRRESPARGNAAPFGANGGSPPASPDEAAELTNVESPVSDPVRAANGASPDVTSDGGASTPADEAVPASIVVAEDGAATDLPPPAAAPTPVRGTNGSAPAEPLVRVAAAAPGIEHSVHAPAATVASPGAAAGATALRVTAIGASGVAATASAGAAVMGGVGRASERAIRREYAAAPVTPTRTEWHAGESAILRAMLAHWCVALAMFTTFTLHVYNMTRSPAYDIDEGAILGQGWATVRLGRLDPYTYWYDHPPLGWITLGLPMWIIRELGIGASAIDAGRVLMLLINLASSFLLFHICMRLTQSRLAAMIAIVVVAASPQTIELHRLVKLDNIATIWLLAAILLLLGPTTRLNQIWWSALCLGAATLSKEPLVFFVPGALFIIFDRIDRERRPLAMVGWIAVYGCVVSVYPLFALLRGELFPSGTYLGGNSEHVSLLGTLFGRSGDIYGSTSFSAQFKEWWREEPVLVWLLSGALGVSIVASIRDRGARIAVALSIPYLFFLTRVGGIRDYWVLPVLPILALNLALMVSQLLAVGRAGAIRVLHVVGGRNDGGSRERLWPIPIIIVAAVLVLLVPYFALSRAPVYRSQFRDLYQRDYNVVHHEAERWIATNLDRDALLIIDTTYLIDLREVGGSPGAGGSKGGFDKTYHYWIADRDPGVRTRLLKDDWRNVDFIVLTPPMAGDVNRGDLPFVSTVVDHANPIAQFGDGQSLIRILAVNRLSEEPTGIGSRPPLVPESARELLDSFSYGPPAVAGVPDPKINVFFVTRCADDLLRIAMSDGVVYTELPCSQEPLFDGFYGRSVLMNVSVGDPTTLTLKAEGQEDIQLAVGRVWLQGFPNEPTGVVNDVPVDHSGSARSNE